MANLDIFRNDPSVRAFDAGAVIFEAGTAGKTMYVVIEGEVDLKLRDDRLIATVGPGEVFGEMALIDDKPRSATAIARDGVRVAPIDEKRFTYLVQNTPYFALEVMRTMAYRVRRMNELSFAT
jgi:CRP-like cAMP-binding protein